VEKAVPCALRQGPRAWRATRSASQTRRSTSPPHPPWPPEPRSTRSPLPCSPSSAAVVRCHTGYLSPLRLGGSLNEVRQYLWSVSWGPQLAYTRTLAGAQLIFSYSYSSTACKFITSGGVKLQLAPDQNHSRIASAPALSSYNGRYQLIRSSNALEPMCVTITPIFVSQAGREL
jgi:hypothetical protein